MTRVLLADERIGTDEILTKEHAMRKSINYENEVATMFEFIMFFAKSWKIACQDKLKLKNGGHLEQVYVFLSEVEAAAYDFSKSVLIDADSMRFKPCVLVASLMSMVIELHLLLNNNKETLSSCPKSPLFFEHIRIACDIWDDLVKKVFGKSAVKNIDEFGHYLFIRQQRIYRLFRVQKEDLDLRLANIYKDRCARYYEHTFYEKDYLKKHFEDGLPQVYHQMLLKDLKKVHLCATLEFPDLITEYKPCI
jgi:hypothetical protein